MHTHVDAYRNIHNIHTYIKHTGMHMCAHTECKCTNTSPPTVLILIFPLRNADHLLLSKV